MTESGEQPQGRPVRVEDYIDKLRARLLAALPLDIDSRHWLAVLAEYLQRNPKLFSCTAISLEGAIVDAAMLGLELGPPFDMASIIPFKSRRLPSPVASLVIEYRGHMAQVYRTGRVRTIEARPVYHQDVFDYQFGREPVLLHRPANDPNRGKLIYAYAIAYFCDGGLAVEVINQHDAARARADSPDAGRPESLWNQREPEMWVKTAIKRLTNRMPRAPAPFAEKPGGDALPKFIELLNAVRVSPELYSVALSELDLECPTDLKSIAAILERMRHLYRIQLKNRSLPQDDPIT